MLKNRRQAATKVADSLFAAEAAIDAALACAADLSSTLVAARTEANLSAIVGQDAFEGAAAALTALVRARADIVETHKRLSQTQIQVGLRTIAFGDGTKPDPEAGLPGRLRAVA